MISYQLDLFKPAPTEQEMLIDEIKKLRESNEKVRKKLFACHGELYKLYFDMKKDVDLIIKNICQK